MLIFATMTLTALPLGAIGFSILYMLFGGGIGGAILIFVLAKFLGD